MLFFLLCNWKFVSIESTKFKMNRTVVERIPHNIFPLFLLIFISLFITVRNSSCGKVMFSQVSVCPQGGGVHPLGRHPHPLGRHPRADTPEQTPPGQTPPRDGYCSGQYASYWNAFLFFIDISKHK